LSEVVDSIAILLRQINAMDRVNKTPGFSRAERGRVQRAISREDDILQILLRQVLRSTPALAFCNPLKYFVDGSFLSMASSMWHHGDQGRQQTALRERE
jgi:hypothetical protein